MSDGVLCMGMCGCKLEDAFFIAEEVPADRAVRGVFVLGGIATDGSVSAAVLTAVRKLFDGIVFRPAAG